jgi:hypothetical protein
VTYRGDAFFRAQHAYGDYIGVVLSAADVARAIPATWHHLDFRNRHILDVWFRDAVNSPDRFVYIAAFDKTVPDWLVEAPIAELAGSGAVGDRSPVGGIVEWHASSNGRGTYDSNDRWTCSDRGVYGGSAFVGNGSLFGHTPGDVENEIDQLHSEYMQFQQQLQNQVYLTSSEARMAGLGYGAAPEEIKQGKGYVPEGTFARPGVSPDLLTWSRDAFSPFGKAWLAFRSEHKDIPWQNLPLSGTWDRIQDFRQKLINLRASAISRGFKIAKGTEPMDPRKDPSFTDAFKALGDVAKYALYGGLAIGGAWAVSKIVQSAKSRR